MTDVLESAESAGTPASLVCDQCPVDERDNCIQCHRVFCPHYASEIDTNFCQVCLTGEAANVVIQESLKGSDGINHEGRWILPAGSIYKTLPRAIADMDNVELEKYLTYMKEQVKNAETTLQYRRIAESTASLELDHRKLLEERRLRGIKLPAGPGGPIKVVAGNGKKAPDLKGIADTLKAMGITKEMLEAVQAMQKAKGGK